MRVSSTTEFGPYHVKDLERPDMLAELQRSCEYELGDYANVKFVGIFAASQSDIDTWNWDYAICDPELPPVFDSETTRIMRYTYTENV
jgi:hypothetical protein